MKYVRLHNFVITQFNATDVLLCRFRLWTKYIFNVCLSIKVKRLNIMLHTYTVLHTAIILNAVLVKLWPFREAMILAWHAHCFFFFLPNYFTNYKRHQLHTSQTQYTNKNHDKTEANSRWLCRMLMHLLIWHGMTENWWRHDLIQNQNQLFSCRIALLHRVRKFFYLEGHPN